MAKKGNARLLLRSAALVFAVVLSVALQGMTQQPLQVLHNHVRPAVTNGQAKLLDSLPSTLRLNLTIMLPIRNEPELKALLARLQDPSGTDYHQFLTVQQFTDRFGPTQADYQAVVDFVTANGFIVTDTPANRLIVPINGTVEQIEKTFNVSMKVYQHPTESRVFFSPDRDPALGLDIPVRHIAGLDDYSVPRPAVLRNPSGASTPSTTGSGPSGNFLASDMRNAYYGGNALTGAGQCVGLMEFGGYSLADVNTTFSSVGQSYSVPINNVLMPGADSGTDNDDDSEQVLDIVQAIGMAPGLSQVRVYIAPYGWIVSPPYTFPASSNDEQVLNRMASEDACKQLSVSWNWEPEPANLGMNDPIFMAMGAQGQTIFVDSTDFGAYPNYLGYYYPAEDDYVVSVGGTNLTTNGIGGPWLAETTWDSTAYCSAWGGCGAGSGGGISPDGLPIPSWQAGVANSANGGSTTLRNVPDVAMEGDFDNYLCAQYGLSDQCSTGWGGTSFATPRWAAFMALVNQQANAWNPLPNGGLGFINQNPGIYSIGNSLSFSSDFHDIITGNNNCYVASPPPGYVSACSNNTYSAVNGYDLTTGWGSPNGPNLIHDLAQTPFIPSYYRCSGNVTNPQGPALFNDGIATMSSGGGGKNNSVASCTYGGFTITPYLTTAPMTLSFGAYADSGAAGRATISVSLFGTVISGSYSGTYTATIPANTDLSTLSVTGYAKVSSIPGDEAEVDIGTITIQ